MGKFQLIFTLILSQILAIKHPTKEKGKKKKTHSLVSRASHDENEGPLSPLCWWIPILVATWVINQVDKLLKKCTCAQHGKREAEKKKKHSQFKNQFDQSISLKSWENPSPKYKGQPKFVIAKKTTLSYKLMKP